MEDLGNFVQITFLAFKNILNKINIINSFIQPQNNNISNLISQLSQSIFPHQLNYVSSTILNELDQILIYIRSLTDKEFFQREEQRGFENMYHEYRNEINLGYFTTNGNNEQILGTDFVKKNLGNIELIVNGQKNALADKVNLREGQNNVKIIIKNKLTSLDNMFKDCKALRNINDLQYLETKDITDFSFMFFGCSSLLDLNPIRYWLVNNGKNFQNMFGGCTSLQDISPLKYWQVSNVTNFSTMFYFCSSLSDLSPLQNWNVSSGENFSGMFSKCKSIYDLSPLQNWNISKGKNFSAMFFECPLVSEIAPFQKWKVPKDAVFSRMFCETKAIRNAQILQTWELPKDKFNSMFV